MSELRLPCGCAITAPSRPWSAAELRACAEHDQYAQWLLEAVRRFMVVECARGGG